MRQSKTTEALITAPFMLLVTGHLIQALGYSSTPLLPLYLGHLEATHSQIGVILAMGSIGGLLLRPVVGWALDAWGRKPTLIVGTLMLVLGMAMIGGVDRIGPLIYIARLIVGVGIGALFTGYFTFATDLIPASRRTEGIALFGVSGLLPLAINPFLGKAGFEVSELRWFFVGLAGVIALSLVALMLLREPERVGSSEPVKLAAVGRALTERALWPVWLATLLFAGLVSLYMAFATLTATARGIDNAGVLWLTYAGGAISVRLFGARLPDRVGPANMVAPALALYVVAMVVTASASHWVAFTAAGALAGLSHGYCFPVLTSQVVTRSPERLRGSALAMFTALWEVAALGLTPAFGMIADAGGDALMFVSAALVGVVGLMMWAPLEHRFGPARTGA